MKWFNNNTTQKQEISVQEIYDTARTFIDSAYYEHISIWNEKDIALFLEHRELLRTKKERDELRGIVKGNKEYYGSFQEHFTKLRNEFETTKHHLELEQKAYQNLYMEKRELEAKLYAAGRELELRGYYGKDLT